MPLNERDTRLKLIDPQLENASWEIERELRIVPGRVNFSTDSMYDASQAIMADYVLRYRGIFFAILEAKGETEAEEDGAHQTSRYADRLMVLFCIAGNGRNWILADTENGEYKTLRAAVVRKAFAGEL